jgi:heme O synthase-like polyprenyltransferase
VLVPRCFSQLLFSRLWRALYAKECSMKKYSYLILAIVFGVLTIASGAEFTCHNSACNGEYSGSDISLFVASFSVLFFVIFLIKEQKKTE